MQMRNFPTQVKGNVSTQLSDNPILTEVSVNLWVDCLMAIRTQ